MGPQNARLLSSESTGFIGILNKYFNLGHLASDIRLRGSAYQQLRVIEKNCQRLVELQVLPEPVKSIPACVCQEAYKLEHKLRLLTELGVQTMTMGDVHIIHCRMSRSLKEFEEATSVAAWEDVVENALRSIGATKRDRIPGLPELSGETPLKELYEACSDYYLKEKLGLSNRAASSIKAYTGYRSFGMMKEALEVLNSADHSKHLLREPRVLLACVDNLRTVIENGKELRISENLSLWDMVCRSPLLLMSELDNVLELTAILKEHDVFTLESLVSCHSIFRRLSAEQCRSRLEALKTDPIWLYRKCSRFPYLLLYKTTTLFQRLEFIRQAAPHRDVTPHEILLPNKAAACRTLGVKLKHRTTKCLTARVLETVLGEHAGRAMQLIWDHPFAEQVELSSMCNTAKFLKQRYSSQDIARNGQLLLHSCAVVAKILEIVLTEYSHERGYEFSGDQQLTVCHYLLERCVSFNGNAIFFKELPEDLHLPHFSEDAS